MSACPGVSNVSDAVARDLGVSRQSITHWYTQWNTHGETGLRAVPHPGPGTSITAEQINTWLQALKRGATAHGFESDFWTTGRATVVLERISGIAYHPDHVLAGVGAVSVEGLRAAWKSQLSRARRCDGLLVSFVAGSALKALAS